VSSALIDGKADLVSFFESAVREAASARHYDPDSPASLYLAGVLAAYAKPGAMRPDALDRPLTILLSQALESRGPDRLNRLLWLGDHVLYVSGFFADHLDRTGTPRPFVQSIGAMAYDTAAMMLRAIGGEARGPDVFGELASNFDALAQVLGSVADTLYAASAKDPRGVLELYERWTRRGSHALAEALVRSGAVPTRGSTVVH